MLPVLSAYYSKNNKSHDHTPDDAAKAVDALNGKLELPDPRPKNLVENTESLPKRVIKDSSENLPSFTK